MYRHWNNCYPSLSRKQVYQDGQRFDGATSFGQKSVGLKFNFPTDAMLGIRECSPWGIEIVVIT